MALKRKISEKWQALRTRIAEAKGRHRALRILLNRYAVAAMIFLLWICFFDSNNALIWLRTQHTLRRQNAQKELLQKEIDDTQTRIDQLSSQKDSLERFAREQYLFHESGEDVYLIR